MNSYIILIQFWFCIWNERAKPWIRTMIYMNSYKYDFKTWNSYKCERIMNSYMKLSYEFMLYMNIYIYIYIYIYEFIHEFMYEFMYKMIKWIHGYICIYNFELSSEIYVIWFCCGEFIIHISVMNSYMNPILWINIHKSQENLWLHTYSTQNRNNSTS